VRILPIEAVEALRTCSIPVKDPCRPAKLIVHGFVNVNSGGDDHQSHTDKAATRCKQSINSFIDKDPEGASSRICLPRLSNCNAVN
jgi:hypothetical protein